MTQLNIELLKKELKLIANKKCEDYAFLSEILNLCNINKIKQNHYYIREGFFFYIENFVDENKNLLSEIYSVLEEQIKSKGITDFLIETPRTYQNIKDKKIKLEIIDLNEKTFAENILYPDLLFVRFKHIDLKSKNVNKIINKIYNENFSISKIEDLKNNDLIKDKVITSFIQYNNYKNNEILEQKVFHLTFDNYIEKVKNQALVYQNSLIKRIFNSNEDKMAFFITGALLGLRENRKYRPLEILKQYTNIGINYSVIKRKEIVDKFDSYTKNDLVSIIQLSYHHPIINHYACIGFAINEYLKNVDWKNEDEKKFNFALLENYVMIPAFLSKSENLNTNFDYLQIIKNYLLSLPEIQRKEEFKIIFLEMNILKYSLKNNELISLMKDIGINYSIISLWMKNDKDNIYYKSAIKLMQMLNIDCFLNKKSNNIFEGIEINNEKVIVTPLLLRENYGMDMEFIHNEMIKIDSNIKKHYSNRELVNSQTISINIEKFQFSGEDLIYKMICFLLLKSQDEINKDMSFNGYAMSIDLNDKITKIDKGGKHEKKKI